jgi:hypothetical protein
MYFIALTHFFQSDRESLLVTQNYELLKKSGSEQEDPRKSGFDPFDPISVKLLTLGESPGSVS